jgi:nicotinamidase-related amidase
MLEIRDCCLIVVDVQGKLAQLMVHRDDLFKNLRILIQAAKILQVPILWCQQVPEALGPTVPEIAELLTGPGVESSASADRGSGAGGTAVRSPIEPINKASFSCCGQEQFNAQLNTLGKEQVLLCGIETHVCIYQTAMDLMEGGVDVTVVADAVSSRTEQNRQIALTRLAAEGSHQQHGNGPV